MMKNIVMFLYVFVLFFVLTPGVLVHLPSKASKMVTAAVHAAIFALVFALTHKMVGRVSIEGAVTSNCVKDCDKKYTKRSAEHNNCKKKCPS